MRRFTVNKRRSSRNSNGMILIPCPDPTVDAMRKEIGMKQGGIIPKGGTGMHSTVETGSFRGRNQA